RQILWNVVKNAAKFTPSGGAITLRAEVASSGAGEVARVVIRDTGIGLAPETIGRIFEAFEQADPSITREFGGLGLGLAISHRLAVLHGGTIRATSDGPGRGATFTLELPMHRGPRAITARPVAAACATTLRLLVVDDHADTADILTTLLVNHGYVVHVATNAKDALALASTHAFDLMISDLGLPDASGYELMQQVRARVGLPGIAMSGWGREEDRRRGIAAGFAAHLVKPIAIADLVATIQRVFDATPRS
ncbi:MAG: ATP-binding protein, partial [Proteobacteria bacterium]|nr:ATP-binding protein [Pseudomonadota bacterium]